MKRLTILNCGDCPFMERNLAKMKEYVAECGIADIKIKDLKAIHPQCELDDC